MILVSGLYEMVKENWIRTLLIFTLLFGLGVYVADYAYEYYVINIYLPEAEKRFKKKWGKWERSGYMMAAFNPYKENKTTLQKQIKEAYENKNWSKLRTLLEKQIRSGEPSPGTYWQMYKLTLRTANEDNYPKKKVEAMSYLEAGIAQFPEADFLARRYKEIKENREEAYEETLEKFGVDS